MPSVALIMFFGLSAAFFLMVILVWSIALPDRRIWPPKHSTTFNKTMVWVLTLGIFCSALLLGVLDWNSLEIDALGRWLVGLPLIVIGNWIAWQGALNLGMAATSGEVEGLKTDGFYQYSRNPQYVADMVILIGWSVLSGSLLVIPVVLAGVLVLMLAPLAEEPWLRTTYGTAYQDYSHRVRRYF